MAMPKVRQCADVIEKKYWANLSLSIKFVILTLLAMTLMLPVTIS